MRDNTSKPQLLGHTPADWRPQSPKLKQSPVPQTLPIYMETLPKPQRTRGFVHITRSQFTNLEHFTISESRLSINFKISTKRQHLDQTSASRQHLKLKSWPNLVSQYWPRFNFITSTKHQQQNTDQTAASKSRLNFNFKILTKVLNVWTKVEFYDQTSASKSATNCCKHDPHH